MRTGQALVEFALILPVFLLLLFGLIDVGRYVYMNTVLSQAAREGARLGAAEAGTGCGSCHDHIDVFLNTAYTAAELDDLPATA